MEEVLDIVVLGRAARNTAAIKNRQPIGNMYVKGEKVLDDLYTQIIREELNVKQVEFTEEVEQFVSYSFKPQLKTVGPKYGKLLGQIKEVLAAVDGQSAMKQLKDEGILRFDFAGEAVELSAEDLLIDTVQSEHYVSESDNKLTVVLDIRLTKELIEEGFVRELISKVQTMRKEAGFEVTDHIELALWNNDRIRDIIKANERFLVSEILCDGVRYEKMEGYEKDWNLNGEDVCVCVRKV